MQIKKLIRKRINTSKKWPIPDYDENDQPHFLFILTPPSSGSTALSQILNTGNKTMILQSRGEGQWLIPGLCEMDRWQVEKYVNYESVKAVWLNKYQEVKSLVGDVQVVVEKSPPNIIRIDQLSSMFRDFSFLANNRDPYASCSSRLYRAHNAEKMNSKSRITVLRNLARKWIFRSKMIEELVYRLKVPLLTYEQLCRDPSSVLTKLEVPEEVILSIDTHVPVKVKDYSRQKILDQNERQISNLFDKEIAEINSILEPNTGLLEFFGYKILEK